jgi:signal peptidase I
MADQREHHQSNVKETIISIIISLAMALVAKAYVIEAFVIPTGSMAPTLLGKHMLFQSDATGNQWAVNPWFYADTVAGPMPTGVQAARDRSGNLATPTVTDPMTTSQVNPARENARAGHTLRGEPKRLRAGDRILVQKLLYEVTAPERYDVVVFKNPTNPRENFIKRLVALPNEAVLLVDGDVFTAPITNDGNAPDEWSAYQIRRKPTRVQEDIWHTVFSSQFTPPEPIDAAGRRFFQTPWSGDGWVTHDRAVYSTDRARPTTLAWDNDLWPINDYNPYNEVRSTYNFRGGRAFLDPDHYFPVSDLRLRAGVEPADEGLALAASIEARGHTFEALLEDGVATLRMRDGEGPWSELATRPIDALSPGVITDIAFWHHDQRLALVVEGDTVLEATYDWDPAQRMLSVVGVHPDDVASSDAILGRPTAYDAGVPRISWRFEGAPVALHRVGIDKDIYFRPDNTQRAAHPDEVVALAGDQFFVLGDNSAASADGRKWDVVDEEVAKIDPTIGVVPERLLLGKAFFVYFPAPHAVEIPILGWRLPMPDLGRMRAIN